MTAIIEAIHIYDERNNPILTHTYTGRPLSAAQLLPQYLEHPPPRPSLIYLPNASPPTLVFSLARRQQQQLHQQQHAATTTTTTTNQLLILATTSREAEPLLVLEFLHRVVDALEEFLGAPLTVQRVEAGHDVAAQLLTEMCDAGTVATTEPNALRDLVEVEGWVGRLLGSIPSMPAGGGGGGAGIGGGGHLGGGGGAGSSSHHHHHLGGGGAHPSLSAALGGGGGLGVGPGGGGASSALPWRRANVRHTSNELYADLVETLSVTLAPSGRPLAAFAHGTIAFTSKVSGVPDIILNLSGPSGPLTTRIGSGSARSTTGGFSGGGGGGGGVAMELPVFHPCVRLARWRERPSELSFIPPDGRFILASYEVDLLPFTSGKSGSLAANNLRLPVSIEMKTGLGHTGAEFEVRVAVNKMFAGAAAAAAGASSHGGGGGGGGGGGRGGTGGGSVGLGSLGGLGGGGPGRPGSLGQPLLEDLRITVPLPAGVRNLPEIRPSKGDAAYSPGDQAVEWSIPTKALSGAGGTTYFALRCAAVGEPGADDDEDDEDGAADDDPMGFGYGGSGRRFSEYSVGGDDGQQSYQSAAGGAASSKPRRTATTKSGSGDTGGGGGGGGEDERDAKKVAQNRMLMPSSASVSFSVRGWLPSGLKVDSILIDSKRSRGLGESVKPYKGVKYLTVSKGGVEIRC